MRKILRLIRNIVFILVLILIVGAFVFHKQIIDIAKNEAADKIAQTVMDSGMLDKVDSKTSQKVNQAKQVYNNMDSSDKIKVENIVKDNMTSENINAAKDYIASGDKQGLEEYAKSKLSSQDQQTLEQLYNKYKNQIPNQ